MPLRSQSRLPINRQWAPLDQSLYVSLRHLKISDLFNSSIQRVRKFSAESRVIDFCVSYMLEAAFLTTNQYAQKYIEERTGTPVA
jgi:hypothetical protein